MRRMLVTGGAGFIGSNASLHFARKGWRVTVLDNLSRKGAAKNLEWLSSQAEFEFLKADVRDSQSLDRAFQERGFDAVLHLAAQVAVTTSVTAPREDFEINAMGTFNLLESIRRYSPKVPMIYASTNKVYGRMDAAKVVERNGRHEYETIAGATENEPLDFHSPYGCSKGAADQYVVDYARIYGMNTAVFRQSCIYGPRQFGVEDQGWVAWFVIAATLGKEITVYGDGKQIRDVLHVDDLTRLYETAFEKMDDVRGQAFNVGGGPRNTISLLELISLLERNMARSIPLRFDGWRPGDQPVFVCDLTKVGEALGWVPEISATQGVQRLLKWVEENRTLFS